MAILRHDGSGSECSHHWLTYSQHVCVGPEVIDKIDDIIDVIIKAEIAL